MKLQISFLSLVLGMLLFSGCASKNMQANNTGFFEDYKQFDKPMQTQVDLSKYDNIIISPLEVKTLIMDEEQTTQQKELYAQISEYLMVGYSKIITTSRFKLSEKVTENTLILKTAVSTVEVHFDDKNWNQIAPIPFGLNVVSFNAYIDEDVRLLGEAKLVDAKSEESVSSVLSIQKENPIVISGEYIEFKDIKAALDTWIDRVAQKLEGK